MAKAKKAPQAAKPAHEGKGFLALAGEAFAVLGEEIIEGKDKVVEVAAAKISSVKKAIKKATHKKAVPQSRTAKKAPAKKAAKKSAGKTTGASKKKAVVAPKKAAKTAKAASKKSAPRKK
jgi:hypothetical protein